MLVIRRRAGESVFIGDEVEVEVLEITPSQVKIGIRAPRHITVLRREIRETEQANKDAAKPVSESTLAGILGKLRPE
jgi:carbon storage regulator